VRTLLESRPVHLLNPQYESWRALELGALDHMLEEFAADGTALADRRWGERNTVRVNHPMTPALPSVVADWFNMPARPLPGDWHMPRVQSPTFGASERLVVSPGREEYGLFHMPAGQSGHPRSPYYGAGHEAWENGEPTPLLPGRRSGGWSWCRGRASLLLLPLPPSLSLSLSRSLPLAPKHDP
jgi:penicillin amidase